MDGSGPLSKCLQQYREWLDLFLPNAKGLFLPHYQYLEGVLRPFRLCCLDESRSFDSLNGPAYRRGNRGRFAFGRKLEGPRCAIRGLRRSERSQKEFRAQHCSWALAVAGRGGMEKLSLPGYALSGFPSRYARSMVQACIPAQTF